MKELLIKLQSLRVRNRRANLDLITTDYPLNGNLNLLPINRHRDLRCLNNKFRNVTWRETRADFGSEALFQAAGEGFVLPHFDKEEDDFVFILLAAATDTQRIFNLIVKFGSLGY